MIAIDGDADRAYIAQRIIDCCLREDLRGISSQGRAATPPPAVMQAWGDRAAPPLWWNIEHWPGGSLWLPVRHSDYMQSTAALSDGWVRQTAASVQLEYGAERWLELLAQELDEETQTLHQRYVDEALLAASHRALAHEAFQQHRNRLAQTLDHPSWDERMLLADQLASYRDHPFYPTARAKIGLDEDAMRAFAPEFNPTFELRWLAVPRELATLSTPAPTFWPKLRELGLDAALEDTHVALPVHPLTWSRLDEFAADYPLPPGSVRALRSYLRVRPTLSVRTVIPLEHPAQHLKLPLLMYTLGALSLRMMKPSSLYDGFWFQRMLTSIAANDPQLRERYLHVDESHYGHVADAKHLSYLLRAYPHAHEYEHVIPVAALCATMPDGRPLARHLADRYHHGDLLTWWHEYLQLLCEVHLRLWLVYGVALEANQQNAVLLYRAGTPLRLLMKDNDAGRILQARLRSVLPELDQYGPLHNERILVQSDVPLGQMFCTITLQLDLLAVLEGVAADDASLRAAMYDALRKGLHDALDILQRQGVDTGPARTLLNAPKLPVKYLLSAGSLLSKRCTGAADIQKFYGDSAPNFMLDDIGFDDIEANDLQSSDFMPRRQRFG